MTGVVRRHIRLQRDLHARRQIQTRHVEFCTECGRAHDKPGRSVSTICGVCGGKGRNR